MTCHKCDGLGRITRIIEPTDWTRDLGDGYYMADGGGITAEPCECVASLPPLKAPGAVTWWTTETVYSRDLEGIIPSEFTVQVIAEVPLNEQGRRLERPGNRYWPTFVEIENGTLHPDQARAFAASLIEAADIADQIDSEWDAP